METVDLEQLLIHAKQFGLERNTDKERLLIEQRDTVARQWKDVYTKMEVISRTCLYCDFVAKTRGTLRTHMRKHLV